MFKWYGSRDSGCAYLTDNQGNTVSLTQKAVAFVESVPILPEFLTGREFIQFMLDIQHDNKKINVEKIFQLVDMGESDQRKLIKTHSHGMKNKIQMATLFISNSPIVFLDEPLTSLDVVVAADIKNMILQMKKERIIILSTHILQIAKDLCDEIVILNDKQLVALDKKCYVIKILNVRLSNC